MNQTRADDGSPAIPLVKRLRHLMGRKRAEFFDHRLGGARKLRVIARRIPEYRRRRAAARDINDAQCLSELSALKRDKVVGLDLDQALLSPLLAACDERIAQATRDKMVVQEGKEFYLDLLVDDDYSPTSSFMRFALDPKLLATVSSYLGSAAYLQSIELIRSQPMPPGTELFRSQLWHSDVNNDTKMLKVFVYVTDVGPDNGPLTFLPSRYARKIPWYQGHYITDETVARYVPIADKVELTGPRGTTSIMDTAAVFHCGSRCIKPRMTFVVHYNTGFGFLPRTHKHNAWEDLHEGLSPLQRFALKVGLD